MALLAEHDRGQVIGLVESSRKDGGTIVVAGSLYSDVAGSSDERIARLATRGFPYQMSVGFFDFPENDVPKGTKATVNGQGFAGPLTILRNGKVRECSIVAPGGANTRGRDEAITRLFAEVG